MESRFCSKCGAPLNPGSKFCGKCGAAVVQRTAVQEPVMNAQTVQETVQRPVVDNAVQHGQAQPNAELPAEKKGSGKKKWVVLSVILAAVILTFAILTTVTVVVVKQIKKHNDQTPASVALLDEEEFEEEENEEEAAAFGAYFPEGDYSGKVDSEGKDSDGMKLPEAGPGEKLYIGYGNLDGIGLTKMAMILSEDRQSVHDIVILLDDISSTLGGYNVMFANMQTSTTTEYDLPATNESLGQSTLEEMHLEGDYIYVRMDYVFTNISFGTSTQDQLIPLGETEIWLKEAG